MKGLAALCHKREPRQIEKLRIDDTTSLTPEPDSFPMVCFSTQSLFCIGICHEQALKSGGAQITRGYVASTGSDESHQAEAGCGDIRLPSALF